MGKLNTHKELWGKIVQEVRRPRLEMLEEIREIHRIEGKPWNIYIKTEYLQLLDLI